LLLSQFETLEPPSGDEDAIAIDTDQPVMCQVAEIVLAISEAYETAPVRQAV
jgi:gluconate kinase